MARTKIFFEASAAPDIIFTDQNGDVWDEGTDFVIETWNDANWNDYLYTGTRIGVNDLMWYFDLAALNQTNGGLPGGDYLARVFSAGGSVVGAAADFKLEFGWSGTEIVTALRVNQLMGGIEATIAAGTTASQLVLLCPAGVDETYLEDALVLPLDPNFQNSWTKVTAVNFATPNYECDINPVLLAVPTVGDKVLIGPKYV